MESQEGHRLAPPLAHRVDANASVAQVVHAVMAAWQEIEVALLPIIGPRGVAALCRRSLHLTAQAHPWMEGARHEVQPLTDVAVLQTVLERCNSADAVVAGGAFLQTFRELLTSLVGHSLTDRLLHSVWTHSEGGAAAKELS